MTGSLFPLLRAAAASEIAKAFGLADGQTPATPDPVTVGPNGPTSAQRQQPDPLISILQNLKLPSQEFGLAGLTAPRPLASLADPALLPATLPFPDQSDVSAAQSARGGRAISSSGAHPAQNSLAPLPTGTTAQNAPEHPVRATDAQSNADLPIPSAIKATLSPAMAEAMSYGAFPFTLGGSPASAASLVIFNAAMAPSWPPALRLNQSAGDDQTIRVAGSQLAQMTPEETAEFLSKMAAMFGFLLVVKKRLSRSLKEEKESILGLFALFGVAMDTLIKGMQMAFDLTAEQQDLLERITIETGGQPSGRSPGRHRLKL